MKHQVEQYIHIIQVIYVCHLPIPLQKYANKKVVTIAIVSYPDSRVNKDLCRTSKTVSKKREVFKNCCTGSVSHRILQSISLAIEIPRVSFPSPTCGRFAGTKQRQYANQQGIKKQWQQGVSVGKYLQELERYNYQEMVLLTIQQCSNHDGANVRCLKLPAF